VGDACLVARAIRCQESRRVLSGEYGEIGRRVPVETRRQCLVRDANEAIESANDALPLGTLLQPMRCECGDPHCRAGVSPTRAEYEAVRAFGSRFVIHLNHENPENASVVSESANFAVIELVTRDDRYQVLARNPRTPWDGTINKPDAIGPRAPVQDRRSR
jgi:hypothetical protein